MNVLRLLLCVALIAIGSFTVKAEHHDLYMTTPAPMATSNPAPTKAGLEFTTPTPRAVMRTSTPRTPTKAPMMLSTTPAPPKSSVVTPKPAAARLPTAAPSRVAMSTSTRAAAKTSNVKPTPAPPLAKEITTTKAPLKQNNEAKKLLESNQNAAKKMEMQHTTKATVATSMKMEAMPIQMPALAQSATPAMKSDMMQIENEKLNKFLEVKPLAVTGFITQNGNIYEIQDPKGIGKIESRQISDDSKNFICNYGAVVVYSDVPCDQMTEVQIRGGTPIAQPSNDKEQAGQEMKPAAENNDNQMANNSQDKENESPATKPNENQPKKKKNKKRKNKKNKKNNKKQKQQQNGQLQQENKPKRKRKPSQQNGPNRQSNRKQNQKRRKQQQQQEEEEEEDDEEEEEYYRIRNSNQRRRQQQQKRQQQQQNNRRQQSNKNQRRRRPQDEDYDLYDDEADYNLGRFL